MLSKLLIASMWLFFCVFLAGSASAQEQARRTPFADGQFWVYRLKSWDWNSFYSSKRLLSGSYRVLRTEGKFKYFYLDDKGNEEPIDINPTFRWLLGQNTRDFRFPLEKGKTWSYQYPARYIANDGGTDRNLTRTAEINVFGREPITTQAGIFQAFRLVKEDWYVPRYRVVTTYYWSPQTRSVVKSFYDASVDRNGTGGKAEFELIGYGAPGQSRSNE